MAKQRRDKTPAPPKAGPVAPKAGPATPKAGPAVPKAGPAAPPTLIDHTRHGIDALRSRRADGQSAKTDPKAQAFGEALERLKADYERLLRRGR